MMEKQKRTNHRTKPHRFLAPTPPIKKRLAPRIFLFRDKSSLNTKYKSTLTGSTSFSLRFSSLSLRFSSFKTLISSSNRRISSPRERNNKSMSEKWRSFTCIAALTDQYTLGSRYPNCLDTETNFQWFAIRTNFIRTVRILSLCFVFKKLSKVGN